MVNLVTCSCLIPHSLPGRQGVNISGPLQSSTHTSTMDFTTSSLLNNSTNNTISDIIPILPEVPVSQEVEDTVSAFFQGMLIFAASIFGLLFVYHCGLHIKSTCFCFEDEDFKRENKIYKQKQLEKRMNLI